MLIETKVTSLLEGIRKLQQMVQNSTDTSMLDKLQSQAILTECEKNLYDTFGINRGLTYERVKIEDSAFTATELINKVTEVAFDIENIYKTLKQLPATKKANITNVRLCDKSILIKNKFTGAQGSIRAEIESDTQLFYVIQYEDGSYNIAGEVNVQFI